MSVTFGCPDALEHEVIHLCEMPGCTREHRCGYCQDGVVVEIKCDAPECNFSNTNARALLGLLGFPTDDPLTGCIEVADLPAARQRIMVLNNRESERAPALREPLDQPGQEHVRLVEDGNVTRIERTRGCRLFDLGNDDDQTLRRLGQLDRLIEFAQVSGFRVTWG